MELKRKGISKQLNNVTMYYSEGSLYSQPYMDSCLQWGDYVNGVAQSVAAYNMQNPAVIQGCQNYLKWLDSKLSGPWNPN